MSGLWQGGRITPSIYCIVADNASAYTFTGTNTWIVEDSIQKTCLIVDPGPDNLAHQEAVAEFCSSSGLRACSLLVTHGHEDHYGGAERLSKWLQCPVLMLADGSLRAGACDLPDFSRRVVCIPAPGHSLDTAVFYMPDDSALFIGDICFEGSSSLIDYPNGNLESYIRSLRRLVALIKEDNVRHVLAGHKEPMVNPTVQMEIILEKRLYRVRQIAQAIATGTPSDVDSLVKAVYSLPNPELLHGCRMVVQSSLEYVRKFNITGNGDDAY